MRGPLKSLAGLACLLVLAATAGCSSGDGATDAAQDGPAASPSASPSAPGSPVTAYAPYVSATTADDNDAAGSPSTYNLAFVVSSGSGCTPRWNGTHAVDDRTVTSRIAKLTDSGADVRVSFGGASGEELAATCDSAEELAQAYGAALDAAGATRADFDVEGDELTDSGSTARRSEAIALLQEERADLEVSFTLPVMPSGLDEDGLAVLESADDHGVEVATVDLMTMNYGESHDGDMGDYALTAARAAHTQLRDVFGLSDAAAWRGMALTPMIGVNDVEGETFTLADAAQVRAFAEEKGIAWVSMWSTFRDRPCDDGSSSDDALTGCSGVDQEAGAFARALAGREASAGRSAPAVHQPPGDDRRHAGRGPAFGERRLVGDVEDRERRLPAVRAVHTVRAVRVMCAVRAVRRKRPKDRLRQAPPREGVEGRRAGGVLETPLHAQPRPVHGVHDGGPPQATRHGDDAVRQQPLHTAPCARAPAGLGHGEPGEGRAGERLGAQVVGLARVRVVGVLQQFGAVRVEQPRREHPRPAPGARGRMGGRQLPVRADGRQLPAVHQHGAVRQGGPPVPGDHQVRRVDRQHRRVSWRPGASAPGGRCRPRWPWRRCGRPRGRRPGRSPGRRARRGARTSSTAGRAPGPPS
ncbi:hypothetical protein SUDANB176_04308 [Streptomyces sp. enrichment culture]